MGYIYWEIKHYKRLGDKDGDWSSTPTIITGHFNKRVQLAIGSKKDTFSFNLMNVFNKYFKGETIFENSDLIKVYAKNNSQIVTEDDLIIEGIILSVSSTIATNNVIRIEGKSRSEMFLEGLSFVTSSVKLSPPAILERALTFHNSNNSNFQITWKATNTSTKDDGSAFPTYYVADFYKPMNYVFERYSSNTYTEDGNYYYYINTDNELVWLRKDSESSYNLEESQCNKIAINNKTDNLVNSLTIKCGTDVYGKGITTFAFNYSSKAKNGTKWKIVTSTNTIATSLLAFEISSNSESFDSEGDQFPTSYDYTTTFGETVSSDDEYNTAIREESKRRGKAEGKAYLSSIREEIIKASVTLPFTKVYSLGGVINCNFPNYSITNMKLRITEIEYKDFSTILHLREDEVKV